MRRQQEIPLKLAPLIELLEVGVDAILLECRSLWIGREELRPALVDLFIAVANRSDRVVFPWNICFRCLLLHAVDETTLALITTAKFPDESNVQRM